MDLSFLEPFAQYLTLDQMGRILILWGSLPELKSNDTDLVKVVIQKVKAVLDESEMPADLKACANYALDSAFHFGLWLHSQVEVQSASEP